MYKYCIVSFVSFFTGTIFSWNVFRKRLNLWYQGQNEYKEKYRILITWLKKEAGNRLEKYLYDHNYSSVAIYGLGEIGELLLNDLKRAKIDVKYAIDKDLKKNIYEIPIYSLSEMPEAVDVIIVTPIQVYSEIKRKLKSRTSCSVVSIEEVINEWY